MRNHYELLQELRSSADWVRSVLTAADASAVHLDPSLEFSQCAFVVLNPHKELAVSPFQFGLPSGHGQFNVFTSPTEVQSEPLENLLEEDTQLVVVMGALNPPKTGRFRLRHWWKLFFNNVETVESQLVGFRQLVVDLESTTALLRRELKAISSDVVVLQAIYDAAHRQTYWDLERVVQPKPHLQLASQPRATGRP